MSFRPPSRKPEGEFQLPARARFGSGGWRSLAALALPFVRAPRSAIKQLPEAGWDWRSFTKVANTTASVTDQPAYGILNGGLAYTTANGAWRVAAEGRNLPDRWYRVAGYDFGNPPIGANLLGGVSQIVVSTVPHAPIN